jgi:O-antigen/teichoic acid export membrane protein
MIGWYFWKDQLVRFSLGQLFSDWRHNWRFGRWALTSQLLSFTMPYLLPWIVVFSEGESATGLLAAAAVLVGATNVLISGVANFLTPLAATAFHESGAVELRKVLKKTAWMFLAVLGGFALLTIPAGDSLATLILGAQYRGAGPLVAVLAFHALAGALGMTAGNGLWALDRPAANVVADVCVIVFTVAAMPALGGAYGVLGFASAMLFGRAVGVTVRFATLHRLLKQVGPTLHAPQ